MDANEHIEKLKDFIEAQYKNQLYEAIQQGKKSLTLTFNDLAAYDPELAEDLLQRPEDVLKAAEYALDQIDLPEEATNKLRIRFRALPQSQKLRIADIRSEHLGKFIHLEGIIRQTSDVRPQVTKARFECAGCSNTLTILQIDSKFKEPTRCTCGWRGKFRLLEKDLIDIQHIKIEESPENLEGAEQPKRVSVIISEDLVDPRMERRIIPGTKIRIYGIIKEVPIPLKTGAQSTRYDLIIEGNNVETVQEDYSDIKLTLEDEAKIKDLAIDPNVFDKLARSIAPSIYGHEKIKEALVLQLFGGIRKVKADQTVTRGDIHVLLIGDPGCIAGNSQVALYYKGMNQIQHLGTEHLQPIKEVVTKIRKNQHDKPYDFATVFHKYPKQPVLKLITETGKEVICTYNQPFLTRKGWERADRLPLDTKIRVIPTLPNKIKKLQPTNFTSPQSQKLKEVSLPQYVDTTLASLYGYILGDGNIKNNGDSLIWDINDEETDLLEPLTLFWKNSFNVEPCYYLKNENPQIKTMEYPNGTLRQIISTEKIHHLEINSKQVASAISFLSHKRVPQEIFQSPKEIIAHFLAWLFEAGGCGFGKGRGRTAIQLKSSSPQLLNDVQLLLLYFGIHSRIYKDNLWIRRANDMALFVKHIGFISQKKITKLNDIIHVINLRTQRRKKYQRWEKIKFIEPCGIMDVYDFEVPLSHKFIANGIVCHNSGKSALLQFISKTAPKARYVGGKGSSGTGLTASVVKDEFLRGWALEAGAIVLANKGILVTDELDKMTDEDRDALHEALEQQSYHPNFEIMFSDGTTQKIGPFVDSLLDSNKDRIIHGKDCEIVPIQKYEVLTTNFNKIYPTKINRVSRHKAPTHFIEVEFTNGRKVTVTPEHPFFVYTNESYKEIAAEKLSLGMFIPAPRKLPCLSSEYPLHEILLKPIHKKIHLPAHIDQRFSRLLGYIASEGHAYYNPKNHSAEIGASNTNPLLIYDMDSLFNSTFQCYINHDTAPAESRPRATKDLDTIYCASLPLYLYFQKNFYGLTLKAPKKIIPNPIRSLDPSKKLEFLRAAFKGDGFVDSERTGYSTSSFNLARGYSDLLLMEGIWNYIAKEYRDGTYYYKIVISASYDLFLRKIVEPDDSRVSRIQDFAKRSKNRLNDRDIYPYPEHINALLKELRMSDGAIFSNIKKNQSVHITKARSYLQSIRKRLAYVETLLDLKLIRRRLNLPVKTFAESLSCSSATIYNLEKRKDTHYSTLLHSLKNEKLQSCKKRLQELSSVIDSDLRFVKIKSIKKIKNEEIKWVYDVTIEPTRAFISEGLVLHNTVTISKANVQSTLSAQTTMLAAANPKLGRFDPYTPIATQINLPASLINRFDLIFPIRDLPNKEKDEKIALHVLETSQRQETYTAEISQEFFRKYLAYAKQHCSPLMSKAAITFIKDFYVTLRNSGKADDSGVKPIPISARQLEALIRLSEASAKTRLDNKVTKEDALRAITLLKNCLMEVGFDPETGQIDIDRISTGITASTRNKIITLKEIVHTLEGKGIKTIPIEEVIAAAALKGIEESKAYEILEQLKRSGDLFEPKKGFIQRI